jgi:type II secretory pathway pseudopilin PulG
LIELMVAVAILGILAGVLVYSFNKPTRKVRTGSEVQAMFAELHRAEGQYALENGVYLATGADASAVFPSSPGQSAQSVASPPSEWDDLKITPHAQNLYCGYVAAAGTADDDIPAFAVDFGMEQPERNWYALYAECDVDPDTTKAMYFSSSVDATTVKRNEGH